MEMSILGDSAPQCVCHGVVTSSLDILFWEEKVLGLAFFFLACVFFPSNGRGFFRVVDDLESCLVNSYGPFGESTVSIV